MRCECRHLSKDYPAAGGTIAALGDVSFDASGHEFVGIVGPSGCGKTTLLKIIAGLVAPTTGTLTVTTDDRRDGPSSALVFQEHGLFPWMTVLDNVGFGLEMQGTARDEARARSNAFIERVGLGAFAHRYPHQLSVGMRQRVGIIRAFVTDPPLLLMDEPFGALDSQTRRVLQGELLRLWRQQRGLVVFVTHDIDEAVRLSDRILVMTGRPGRILEEIPIPLDRPRDLARLEPREISELKWHIWSLLEDEVRRGLGIVS